MAFKIQDFIIPIATATIAWGLFPRVPRVLRDIASNEIIQYFFVFVLIWQSPGSNQSISLAVTLTVAMFLFNRLLDGNFNLFCPQSQSQPPPPVRI